MIARLVRDMLHLRMKSQMKNLSIQPNCGWRSDIETGSFQMKKSLVSAAVPECAEFPCDNIRECFAVTKSFEPKCREVCTEAEYEQIKKAFFEKEENLKALQAANIKDGI